VEIPAPGGDLVGEIGDAVDDRHRWSCAGEASRTKVAANQDRLKPSMVRRGEVPPPCVKIIDRHVRSAQDEAEDSVLGQCRRNAGGGGHDAGGGGLAEHPLDLQEPDEVGVRRTRAPIRARAASMSRRVTSKGAIIGSGEGDAVDLDQHARRQATGLDG
jgi:hypothetical protein